jgi:conjugal transfer pilus assembly protein TraF
MIKIMKAIKIIFVTAFSMLVFFPDFANADNVDNTSNINKFYGEHAQGWHWYNDPIPNPTQKESQNNQNPVLKMDAVKEAIKQSLDQALLNPTPENVRQYMSLQNQWTSQAAKFSRVWQYVLLEHPELDYSLKFPTNQAARDIYIDSQKSKEDAAIHQLATHSGLFYFYRSTCPYCQRFSPILKAFSERYKITVIPITTDGIALPEFPNTRVDNGQARRFNVTEEPALFTVDPYTHKATPVSYGLLSEDELRTRILDVATHFDGDVP